MKAKLFLIIIAQVIIVSMKAQTPGYAWAQGGGGTSGDQVLSMSADPAGNTVICGYYQSTSVIFGNDTLVNAGNGHSDLFVIKYDPSGNVLWAKTAGGIYEDKANDVTIDASGNVLVTGSFESSFLVFDSDTVTNFTSSGTADLFIVKYDAAGNVLWAKGAGNTAEETGQSITADAAGNVIVAASFFGPSVSFGSTTLTNSSTGGYSDIALVKYDASGNVAWAKSAGGSGNDVITDMTTDVSGNIFITGSYSGPDISFETTTFSNTGQSDLFLVKYNPSGNVTWARKAGGVYFDDGRGVATDAAGNVFLTGTIYSSVAFGSDSLSNPNGSDAFIAKYDATGTVLWAKNSIGNSWDEAFGVTTDISGNAIIAGGFVSPSVAFGSITLVNTDNSSSSDDMFIVKYDAAGNEVWALGQGGASYSMQRAYGIAADGAGDLYATGSYAGGSVTFGSSTLPMIGSYDVFTIKLNGTTGIRDVKNESAFTVYPNPFNTDFTIKTEDRVDHFEILNLLGETVFVSGKLQDHETKVELAGQPDGIYFIKLSSAEGIFTQKLIKNGE